MNMTCNSISSSIEPSAGEYLLRQYGAKQAKQAKRNESSLHMGICDCNSATTLDLRLRRSHSYRAGRLVSCVGDECNSTLSRKGVSFLELHMDEKKERTAGEFLPCRRSQRGGEGGALQWYPGIVWEFWARANQPAPFACNASDIRANDTSLRLPCSLLSRRFSNLLLLFGCHFCFASDLLPVLCFVDSFPRNSFACRKAVPATDKRPRLLRGSCSSRRAAT